MSTGLTPVVPSAPDRTVFADPGSQLPTSRSSASRHPWFPTTPSSTLTRNLLRACSCTCTRPHQTSRPVKKLVARTRQPTGSRSSCRPAPSRSSPSSCDVLGHVVGARVDCLHPSGAIPQPSAQCAVWSPAADVPIFRVTSSLVPDHTFFNVPDPACVCSCTCTRPHRHSWYRGIQCSHPGPKGSRSSYTPAPSRSSLSS